jgi:transposase
MEAWTGAQNAFAVKAFYKNGDSFVIAQREFRREFEIHHNRAVPSAHAIKTWVRNFEDAGSTLKKKGGSVKTVRTPENIAIVREDIERSPHRSARRHSVSLGMSEAGVRRILHKDLHFFPYKIHVTHALHERDYVNRANSCGDASKTNG